MNVSDLKDLGNTEFRNGNFDIAVQHFSKAIDKDEKNHILFKITN